MNKRHSYRLIRDLFAPKTPSLVNSKYQSECAKGLPAPAPTVHAPSSTDGGNRRAAMEARQRADCPILQPGNQPRQSPTASTSQIHPRYQFRCTCQLKAPQLESEDAPTVNTQVVEPVTNGAYTGASCLGCTFFQHQRPLELPQPPLFFPKQHPMTLQLLPLLQLQHPASLRSAVLCPALLALVTAAKPGLGSVS
ncbi:Fps/Fes/Fer/CIP4 homology [Penicillium robsamsonii]|uniref:Fps/Fes/Fer/CIP4 homology n=1 Tax=Penicillium robsamsonii TaxID=1792511 RepID=UPI002546FD8C|nr:Fps/Fes/Fer/CIP4 homology [Penicillium robsamsonii]KAJ5818007.1 Fps/Fes/Fer/CIP4 homology [Penicillium robsamsonii]